MSMRFMQAWARDHRRPAWQPSPRHEQEARAAMAKPAPAGVPARDGFAAQDALPIAGGRALSLDERRSAEAQLGRDFSGVRVHTDPQSAEAAEALGARAFAYGRDVVFGAGQFAPHTAGGRELIAHELTHIAQQSEAGQAAMQFQPKKEKAGIGAAPPSEPFITMDEAGAEDDHILFEKDSAALDIDDIGVIKKTIGTPEKPITLHLHGYASEEGPGDYNRNLSAHRAAAVKTFLEGLLPEGSKVWLFAHGESKEFGESKENRRVGLSLIDSTPLGEQSFKPKFDLGLGLSLKPGGHGATPSFEPQKTTPGIDYDKLLNKPPVVPPGPILPTAQPLLPYTPLTPAIPYDLMDLQKLNTPAALHGTDLAHSGDVMGDWAKFYLQANQGLGLSKTWAARWANFTLANAYQADLERNRPNIFDKSNADLAARYPNELHTPIIPIITPDTLDFGVKYGAKYGGIAVSAVGGAFEYVGNAISSLWLKKKEKKGSR